MTEQDIKSAIKNCHKKNFVCVPNCKTGPSMGASGFGIMDMWCMAKSWAHPLTIGYEIKCSRSDFLNDKKWPMYLDFCNELYFITPGKHVATPEEMPEGVGLKYVSTTGTRIYTKKKAVWRDVVIPEEIYRYILMHRAKIGDREIITDKKELWIDWLKTKEFNQLLGMRVSKSIREVINGEMYDLKCENKEVKAENERYADVRECLESMGIDLADLQRWDWKERIADKMDEIKTGFSKEFIETIDELSGQLEKIKQLMKEAPERERKM